MNANGGEWGGILQGNGFPRISYRFGNGTDWEWGGGPWSVGIYFKFSRGSRTKPYQPGRSRTKPDSKEWTGAGGWGGGCRREGAPSFNTNGREPAKTAKGLRASRFAPSRTSRPAENERIALMDVEENTDWRKPVRIRCAAFAALGKNVGKWAREGERSDEEGDRGPCSDRLAEPRVHPGMHPWHRPFRQFESREKTRKSQ
jgi:hypothetical protein